MTDAFNQTFERWLRLSELTSLLALKIYSDKGVPVSDQRATPFVDAELDLLGHGHNFGDTAIITFRGTVGLPILSTNWRKVNLCFGWAGEPRRHRGFHEAWMRLRPKVVNWLEAQQPRKVVITGHSLGAALAQLAAFDLAGSYPIERVFLYAPPMVGDHHFNEQYDRSLVGGLTVRYLMLTDAISVRLPCLLGFKPGKPVTLIDRSGRWVEKLPGPLEQIVAILTLGRTAPYKGSLPGVAQSNWTAELGKPSIFEQSLPNLASVLIATGLWGWIAYAGLVAISVPRRALGFHSMEGYARAFGNGGIAEIQSLPLTLDEPFLRSYETWPRGH